MPTFSPRTLRPLLVLLALVSGLGYVATPAQAAPTNGPDDVETWAEESFDNTGLPGMTYVAVDDGATVSVGGFGSDSNGEANQQIARRLSMAEGTVKVHVSAILSKLEVDNRVSAALCAVEAQVSSLGIDDDRA